MGNPVIVAGLGFANLSNETICEIFANDGGSKWVGEIMGIKTIIDIGRRTQR